MKYAAWAIIAVVAGMAAAVAGRREPPRAPWILPLILAEVAITALAVIVAVGDRGARGLEWESEFLDVLRWVAIVVVPLAAGAGFVYLCIEVMIEGRLPWQKDKP